MHVHAAWPASASQSVRHFRAPTQKKFRVCFEALFVHPRFRAVVQNTSFGAGGSSTVTVPKLVYFCNYPSTTVPDYRSSACFEWIENIDSRHNGARVIQNGFPIQFCSTVRHIVIVHCTRTRFSVEFPVMLRSAYWITRREIIHGLERKKERTEYDRVRNKCREYCIYRLGKESQASAHYNSSLNWKFFPPVEMWSGLKPNQNRLFTRTFQLSG